MTERVWRNRYFRCEHGFCEPLCCTCHGALLLCAKCKKDKERACFVTDAGVLVETCDRCRACQKRYAERLKARKQVA